MSSRIHFHDQRGEVMQSFRIGIVGDCLRMPPRQAVRVARRLGVGGIQLYAVSGELAPEAMTKERRCEFCRELADEGMELTALCGDLGGHGFARSEENPGKIARTKQIIDLASDLGTKIVTTHIGVIPSCLDHPRARAMEIACREVGDYAESRGIRLAIETGPETAVVLRDFIERTASPGIGVNFDPANLVMIHGEDPVLAVRTLAPWIVHTHAKDGVRMKSCDPEMVYDAFADGGFQRLLEKTGALFEEKPLGEGSIDWTAYLLALSQSSYTGWLTIEREAGSDPERDMTDAITFLRDIQKKESVR